MDLNYLLKIQERLNNTWNNLPKEVQEGKYSCPEIQEYNEIDDMRQQLLDRKIDGLLNLIKDMNDNLYI